MDTVRVRRPWPVKRSGFSTVSVLVAIVLVTVAVVALSSSSAFVVSLQTEASERATAAAIATSYMEQVKIRPPSQLSSEAAVRVDETGAESPGGPYIRSLTIRPDPEVADALRVAVQVQYPSGLGRTRSVALVTIIYKGSV